MSFRFVLGLGLLVGGLILLLVGDPLAIVSLIFGNLLLIDDRVDILEQKVKGLTNESDKG